MIFYRYERDRLNISADDWKCFAGCDGPGDAVNRPRQARTGPRQARTGPRQARTGPRQARTGKS